MSETKYIAFTFDDAPAFDDTENNPTADIIKEFYKYGGKATFFLVGESLKEHGRRLVDCIIENGFEIANHTYSHCNLVGLSKEKIIKEILSLQDVVSEDFGIKMRFMRPSGLKFDDTVCKVTEELKMPMIFGSFGDAYVADWKRDTPESFIVEHCLDYVYSGQIILMHSYSENTALALKTILKTLCDDGYEFVTLSELFEKYNVKDIPCDRPLVDAQLKRIN